MASVNSGVSIGAATPVRGITFFIPSIAHTTCFRSLGLLPVGIDSNSRDASEMIVRYVSTKQRRRWKIRKYHFKLRLKRTMRKMRVPYMSSKSRGQVKKKPILYDFRPYLRRKLKRAER